MGLSAWSQSLESTKAVVCGVIDGLNSSMSRRLSFGLFAALCCIRCGRYFDDAQSNTAGTEGNFFGIPYTSDGAGGGTLGSPSVPSNPPVTPISTPSPFAGQFVGAWTAPSNGESGTADIVVTADGSLTGTLHDSQSGLTQSLIGTISPSGAVTAHIVSTGTPVAGSFLISSSGGVSGALGVPQPTTILNESFNLAKK